MLDGKSLEVLWEVLPSLEMGVFQGVLPRVLRRRKDCSPESAQCEPSTGRAFLKTLLENTPNSPECPQELTEHA